jgi:predicted PhzF superfamily epimerase YddE/YHI9
LLASVERGSDDEVIEFTGAQGDFIERPGRVTVALSLQGGALCAVSIIGEAVIVFAGVLANDAMPDRPAQAL